MLLFEQDDDTTDPNVIIANMGNAPLAASLKNFLLDWSSSSFFITFIAIEVYMLPPSPEFGVSNHGKVWK